MKNSTPTWKPTRLINLAASEFLSKRLTWPTDWEISCMINCGSLIRRRTIYQMNDWLNDTLTHPLTLWWMAASFDWLTDTVSNKLIRLDNNHQNITKLKFGACALLFCLRRTFCVLQLVWNQPMFFFNFPSDAAIDSSFYWQTDSLSHWPTTTPNSGTCWHSVIS